MMFGWQFGDVRLSERAQGLFEQIVHTGSLVLRRVGGDRAGEIGAHRFLDNDKVSPQAIIDTLSGRTIKACAGRSIVAVQDTSEVNFAQRDASRSGLGAAGGGASVGFFIHPLIAVDLETGAVLGLVDAQIYTRPPGPTANRRRLAFEEKESVRWLTTAQSAQTRLAGAARTIVVADRESDIYSVFARRPQEVQLVIRASHNRKTAAGKRLFDEADQLPHLGCYDVEIGAKPGKKARIACLDVRAGQVQLCKPDENLEPGDPASINVNVVEVREQNPPDKIKPVIWRLLTTEPVSSFEQACQVVQIYRLRWRIEEVFRALKSNGLDLEATQIEAAHRLFKLAALGLAAATRIIQLVDARDGSSRPADDVADPALFEAFAAISKSLEGKTIRQKNPHTEGTLSWLAWITARLGGWNCYYKPPGPKTMATGWNQLASTAAGFMLAKGDKDV